jgi:hypothetical protein
MALLLFRAGIVRPSAVRGAGVMYANEAPIPTADRSIHVERRAPLPGVEPPDPDDVMAREEEDAPEEAGYGYGV